MEIDREVPIDPIDRADYFIESVVDDHVKEAMRKLLRFRKARLASVLLVENGQCGWWMKPALRAATNLRSITLYKFQRKGEANEQ